MQGEACPGKRGTVSLPTCTHNLPDSFGIFLALANESFYEVQISSEQVSYLDAG